MATEKVIALAAAIQAVSAIVIAVLTYFLVRGTNKYAATTERILEMDWKPDLRIAEIQVVGTDVILLAANLAKPAALVKQLKIGTGGVSKKNHPPQDIEAFPMRLLVAGGEIKERSVHLLILEYANKFQRYDGPIWDDEFVPRLTNCAGKRDLDGMAGLQRRSSD